MHSSCWDTSSLATIWSKDVRLSWSFIGDWLGSWSTTLGFDRSNRFQLKRCGRVRFIGWSQLQTMPGNGRVELSFVMQTRSTSSISARENVASASKLIAYVIHKSGSATTASQNMSFESNNRNEKCQSVSLLEGGFGPPSFHLVFCSVLIKNYLGKPCTIRKILLSSFRVFSSFLLWISCLRRYFISQKRLNSVWWGAGGPVCN